MVYFDEATKRMADFIRYEKQAIERHLEGKPTMNDWAKAKVQVEKTYSAPEIESLKERFKREATAMESRFPGVKEHSITQRLYQCDDQINRLNDLVKDLEARLHQFVEGLDKADQELAERLSHDEERIFGPAVEK